MKKAFSLFELSIVILIISILIAGTLQGSKIINEVRLTNAQNLTENSVIKDIDGLVAWFETSLESSFYDADIEDGTNIATWHDRNFNALIKNHATQSDSGKQPKFYSKVFYGAIPALRFDGVDDLLNFNALSLELSPYTIFIVEKRRSSADFMYFISTSSLAGVDLVAGYNADTFFSYKHSFDSTDLIIPAYNESSEPARLHTLLFNSTNGARYWLNGGSTADASNTSQLSGLAELTGAAIGASLTGSSYYNGDIAEIIIFNRNLTTTERRGIESYLSKKYSIAIS